MGRIYQIEAVYLRDVFLYNHGWMWGVDIVLCCLRVRACLSGFLELFFFFDE